MTITSLQWEKFLFKKICEKCWEEISFRLLGIIEEMSIFKY